MDEIEKVAWHIICEPIRQKLITGSGDEWKNESIKAIAEIIREQRAKAIVNTVTNCDNVKEVLETLLQRINSCGTIKCPSCLQAIEDAERGFFE